ncbi:MFS transporter [Candidatus Kaiserbacteria bacterium]|nr:MFS transporter [Candidatus Kaiserbacteria bacterium]
MSVNNKKLEYNRKIHILSLSATKFGDGLVDPKLVLAWLLNSLGAGLFWVGLLVPVREAGALLPQLFTANYLRRVRIRKWWWVIGSLVQGVAVLAIALVGLNFTGNLAGLLIIFSLSVFAIARSICSVSYKDVMGKTVEKPKRGLVTGTASSVAAFGVLLFGLLLMFGVIEQRLLVFLALFLASFLWLIAGWQFSSLREEESEISVSNDESVIKMYFGYLTKDAELQKFLVVRALLTATAVAPPFLILLAESETASLLSQLGGLVVASSFATFLSGRIWGSLSDRSSSMVLALSGLASTVFLIIALGGASAGWYNSSWFLPVILFGVMVSYQGVRIARSVHLVNLANEKTRAAYTAISNTIIGVVLLATGLFGLLAEVSGVQMVVWFLVGMSLLGGLISFSLENP